MSETRHRFGWCRKRTEHWCLSNLRISQADPQPLNCIAFEEFTLYCLFLITLFCCNMNHKWCCCCWWWWWLWCWWSLYLVVVWLCCCGASLFTRISGKLTRCKLVCYSWVDCRSKIVYICQSSNLLFFNRVLSNTWALLFFIGHSTLVRTCGNTTQHQVERAIRRRQATPAVSYIPLLCVAQQLYNTVLLREFCDGSLRQPALAATPGYIFYLDNCPYITEENQNNIQL